MAKKEDRFKEAIQGFKARGVDTYTLTCATGEQCVIRQPSPKETAKFIPQLAMSKEPDFLKVGTQLIIDMWIAGDDAIRTNEDLMTEVALAALNLVQLKVADVKKN